MADDSKIPINDTALHVAHSQVHMSMLSDITMDQLRYAIGIYLTYVKRHEQSQRP